MSGFSSLLAVGIGVVVCAVVAFAMMAARRRTRAAASPAAEPSSRLGAGIRVEGMIAFEEKLVIDGTFDGHLASNGSTVRTGEASRITGTIAVHEAVLGGDVRVETIRAERLELLATANVIADVACHAIVVADGAQLAANVRMDGEAVPAPLSSSLSSRA